MLIFNNILFNNISNSRSYSYIFFTKIYIKHLFMENISFNIVNLFNLYIRGGFKLSIETDKYQFIFLSIIIILSIYFILGNLGSSSWDLIKNKSSNLIDKDYIPNYTAFLTFFIAVAATNLFHQGNWQRVFSAKNNNILKTSLIYSSIITFIIVFWFGYSGLISISINSEIVPDLAFFELMLKNQNLVIVLNFNFSDIINTRIRYSYKCDIMLQLNGRDSIKILVKTILRSNQII